MKHYFGSHWSDTVQGLHTSVWLDEDGKENAATYNVSDYTGDHDVNKPRRKDASIKKEIQSCYKAALAEAIAKKQYADARRRDTKCDHLKYCFLVTKGRGGVTWYTDEAPDTTSKTSGYAITDEEIDEINRLKIPFVDSTTVPEELIFNSVSFPMYPGKPDNDEPGPWGSLSFAPISVVAALYARIGAVVKNIDIAELSEDMFRQNSVKELMAIRGWTTGNAEMLGKAMTM